ncbi:cyclin-dependent protein kinase inhibitor SMR13 [Punica granatum]|uniref:Uncharacterized protein n=2 Tax=Punica granatum TaxID=22663 RepID=A0A218WMP1_PUNGR|nr:cyclin-dependent protein kinase inhibitor SMR13 [Punica granatum]OWM73501.1 hypothetical protein CDL15_Pgr026600 [Punica granatum]PKI60185.1 hypothetical protein CRG98_019373 [Punica granatum]
MAPKGCRISRRRSPRSSRTTSAPSAAKPRRNRRKKRLGKPKNQEVPADSPSTSMSSSCTSSSGSNPAGTGGISCSTPKARRYRIPAIETCPPAPKKQRVVSKNCFLQRRPIAFFAHPDIELFFNFAFRGISV